jgi:hypothetical protein
MAHALKGIATSAILLMPGLRIVNYKAILKIRSAFGARQDPSLCLPRSNRPLKQPSVKI